METPQNTTKRILVVEDEISIGTMCRRILSGEGFEIDVAVNGKVAQNMLMTKQYDLCIFDIRMPEMDGKQLYFWMKQDKPESARAVIFTSGSVMGNDTLSFIEESGRPFLAKPFTANQLIATVKKTFKELEK